MPYEVQTPGYEGPFDLLLHLILREQVDIYEVRLSRIVDAYLIELDRYEHVDLDVATEFLLIAATLVELKSCRLLPGEDRFDIDDELDLWNERDLLLARLLECKTFKDAAGALSRLSVEAGRSYPRTAGLEEQFVDLVPDLLSGVAPADLRAACIRALTPAPAPSVDLEHVAPIRASVTDAVEELLDELPRAGRITFSELCQALVGRLEIVVRFLAVLELYKQGAVELEQASSFGTLTIVWNADGDGSPSERPRGTDAATARIRRGSLAAVDRYEG